MPQSLLQQITEQENFYTAWRKVRSNLGAPGIDRVSVEEFEKNLYDNLALLREIVLDGSYQSLPYLHFTHAKDDGKMRTLRIPTVRDRVVQQAILLVIQPIYEKIFLNCSYAYRPGKSTHKAIERVERNLKRGRVWVVDADIENFFDEVDRPLLMQFVSETIAEEAMLKLIEQSIYALESKEGKGMAQGMVLAPILSNIYLHKMDDRMMRAEWNYIRYSDNVLVLCKSEEEANQALARAQDCLQQLKLIFNTEKTSVCHLRDGFSFLGFYFDESGKRPAEPAVRRLHAKVEKVLQKASELSHPQLREKLESIVRGWLNYFKLKQTDKEKLLQQLEQETVVQLDSIPHAILKAALEFQLGDRDGARKTLKSGPTVPSQDAEINYQWGLLCEVLGMQNEALDSYLAAFRLNPQHPEVAYHLGLHHLKKQKNEQAIRYFQKAVQLSPDNAAVHFALGTALQNMGLHGAARKSRQRAEQLDNRIKKIMQPQVTKPPTRKETIRLKFTNQDLNHFLKLFAGREGVYSRQWLNNQGKTGYTPIHHPLDASKLKEHFNGRETLGYYLMRADNTVLQTVIDLDITRQARADIARSGDLSEWRRLLQVDADKICQILRELEIPYLIEDSGFKGLHIWIFWAAPILARDVNQFARALLGKAGPPPPGLHREVFPRETRVAPEALGSMVKLPLGIHKLTGRRCLFLDSTGEPFADQFAALRTFQPVTPDQFMAALDKLKAPELPVIEEENLDFTPIEKILQGCNVVRHLKEKAEKTKWLNHIERLTILSVFGHFGKVGEHTIHKIIGQTTNYSYRITQKWLGRLRPYPISCPKIREWHSHVTPVLGCPCDFPNVPNSYPSPVLHADPEFIVKVKTKEKQKRSQEPASKPQILEKKKSETQLTPSIKAQQGVPVEKQPPPRVDLNINELFQNYLKIKGQERELTQKLVEIEQKFHQICEQNNTDQLETEIGTLKRIKVGSEFRWVVDL